MSYLKTAEITIDRLAFGGAGVGRIDGKACFVPFSAPGDRLKIKTEKEHRSWTEGSIIEIIEPSSHRVEPFCPHFRNCGGCDWQHISHDFQCEAKRNILVDSLARIGSISEPPVPETVASPVSSSYRARAQFKLFQAFDGLKAGFFRRGSRHVVDLPEGCPLVTKAVNSAFIRLRNAVSLLPDPDRVPQITIDEGEEGTCAILHYIGADHACLEKKMLKQRESLGLAGLFIQSGRKDTIKPVFGQKSVAYKVPAKDYDMILKYEMGSFSQVNRQQNREMLRLVRSLLGTAKRSAMLDIYCGNGNFSLPLSDLALEMTGLEGYEPSIASAVDNSRQASVNNSTFICVDAAEGLADLLKSDRRFDLVILDPPRAGALDVVRKLDAIGARDVVYISCDPTTLARDLSYLAGPGIFRLETAIPLDMFPHTAHLETVTLLKRI